MNIMHELIQELGKAPDYFIHSAGTGTRLNPDALDYGYIANFRRHDHVSGTLRKEIRPANVCCAVRRRVFGVLRLRTLWRSEQYG